MIALLLATSGGFIASAHFLTCDSPLLFFMLLAFFFCERIAASGAMSDYLLAGITTGVCAATKYNGLAVGIAIVVAHLFSRNAGTWRARFFDRRLLAGLACVPLGFLAANPYALLDRRKFVEDFFYNYAVTPRYEGQSGTGYLAFLAQLPEIVGWPGTLLLAAAVLASAALLVFRRAAVPRPVVAGFAIAASVALLYYYKMGAFPRTPARFVLPAVPLFILMSGPFWRVLAPRPFASVCLLAPVLAYNCVCSFIIGDRFNDDPRLHAQKWFLQNVRTGLIEASSWSPHWALLYGWQGYETRADRPNLANAKRASLIVLRMPPVNGRAALFATIFRGTRSLVEQAARKEGTPDEQLFTRDALTARNPDYVTMNSHDLDAPSATVQSYYADLCAGKFPYEIVLDEHSPPISRWIYPRDIDFLENRTTILRRRL